MELRGTYAEGACAVTDHCCRKKTVYGAIRIALTATVWLAMAWIAMHFLLVWFYFSITLAEGYSHNTAETLKQWQRSSQIAIVAACLVEMADGVVLVVGLRQIFSSLQLWRRMALALGGGVVVTLIGFAVAIGSGGALVDPVIESSLRRFVSTCAEAAFR